MQKGDIVLFYSKGLWGKIVDKLTKGKYGHSEILIDENISRKIYYGGITVNFIYDDRIGIDYDIYRPAYSSRTNRDRAVKWAMRQIYQRPKYGFLNLMAFVFIRVLRKLKVRWFESEDFATCSEADADCLEAGSLRKHGNIPNSLLSPNDLPRVFNMFLDSGII